MFDDDFDLDAEEPESPCGVTAFDVERASRRKVSAVRRARARPGPRLYRDRDDGAVRRPRGLNKKIELASRSLNSAELASRSENTVHHIRPPAPHPPLISPDMMVGATPIFDQITTSPCK